MKNEITLAGSLYLKIILFMVVILLVYNYTNNRLTALLVALLISVAPLMVAKLAHKTLLKGSSLLYITLMMIFDFTMSMLSMLTIKKKR